MEKQPVQKQLAQASLMRDYWLAKFPAKIVTLQDGVLTMGEIYDIITSIKSQFQPPVAYRTNFMRCIIKQLESEGGDDDALDQWYDLLETLSDKNIKEEQTYYRIYDVGHGDERIPVKIFEEEKAFVSQGSTGLITWGASFELAKWLTLSSFMCVGTRCSWIFELGCGTGLLSIATAKKFPFLEYVCASDVHDGVLQRCRQNVETNELNDTVATLRLDWKKDERLFRQYFERAVKNTASPGVLLGADIFFDKEMAKGLGNITSEFLSVTPAGRVYFSSEIRNEDTFCEFKREIESHDLSFDEVHKWEPATGAGNGGVIVEVKPIRQSQNNRFTNETL